MGLFGLAAYTTAQRTKEIGIRKVLGARVPGIIALVMASFVKWVLISNALAWPLAYLGTKKWLEEYAYRINMDVRVFIMATLTSLTVAALTVCFQAVKAARTNPIDTLRYE
jgi:putative ABC transport system permease protein